MRGSSVRSTGFSLSVLLGEELNGLFLVITADSFFSEYSSQCLEVFNCERSVEQDFLTTGLLVGGKRHFKE